MSDVDLVQRAKAGDQRAFESLFREHQANMYRLALHFTRSPETAADVTQEAFVKAWEQLPRLRDEAAFSGWLRSILLNAARDAWRQRQPHTALDDDADGAEGLPDPGPPPENGIAEAQFEETVRRAVMSLPEHQRTVVVMHHLEGKPVDEIAADLGLKKGTVVSRLSRGRDLLKRKLEGHLPE